MALTNSSIPRVMQFYIRLLRNISRIPEGGFKNARPIYGVLELGAPFTESKKMERLVARKKSPGIPDL